MATSQFCYNRTASQLEEMNLPDSPGTAAFSGSRYPKQILLFQFRRGTKNVGLTIPRLYTRLWKAFMEDYETASPRICVNRRTPPCHILNFPDSVYKTEALRFSFPRNEYCLWLSTAVISGANIRKICHKWFSDKIFLLFRGHRNTSMPLSINIWHSRVCLIWLLLSSLNLRVPL